MPPLGQPLLHASTGRAYWRSLDELADTPDFRRWLDGEFPGGALAGETGVSRRHFLKLMAASFALAGGVAGCRDPERKIVPYVRPQQGLIPGRPLYFATTLTRDGYGRGVVVQSREGRPIKIEGNPRHPASLGRTDAITQAEMLTFYDPERSAAVSGPTGVSSWGEFLRALRPRLAQHQQQGGRGLHLLTGRITSPALLAALGRLLTAFPDARWYVHEPIDDAYEAAALQAMHDRAGHVVHNFAAAERILSFDCDFLFSLPGSVRYAHDFALRRRVDAAEHEQAEMNRLYVAEPAPSVTGAKADHRLRCRPHELLSLAYAAAAHLGVPPAHPAPAARLGESQQRWIDAAMDDLNAHRGRALVLAGREQPPAVHALAHAMNARLGAFGETLHLIPPLCRAGERLPERLEDLTAAAESREVETLLILDANPVFTAPPDMVFSEQLGQIEFTAHLSLYRDETGQQCRWHLPLAHELESWGDARGHDGTASLIQPLIAPLYRGKTALELLALLQGAVAPDAQSLLKAHWQSQHTGADFEDWWRTALQTGVIPDSVPPPIDIQADSAAQTAQRLGTQASLHASTETKADGLQLIIRPDRTVWNGRYANNAWLQELPDPLTSMTWGNAALISPALAKQHDLHDGDVISLTRAEAPPLSLPVFILPGMAEQTIAVALGYGRRTGNVATGVGVDVALLRRGASPWHVNDIRLQKTDQHVDLPLTQQHHALEGRHMFRGGALHEFRKDPHAIGHHGAATHPLPTLYPEYKYTGAQWGMAIDLTTCIGCGACTLACQAENNIPVVGAEQVRRGREMHWIRVDRYFAGPPDEPEIHHQPVPCMHCEKAPCELVCPVGATMHSSDGLNEMIYNRCIGTRYCSNNCPYKVRRFNFLRYSNFESELLALLHNPEVSVRARGVMEKCTYCVQRIRAADVEARKADRPIREGEVVTACQQVCPTEAIIFGDVNSPDSLVSRTKRQAHNYQMLAELNTQPRTSYLAEVRNPNLALSAPSPEHA